MAHRTYTASFGPRLANRLFRALARLGRGPQTLYVLHVPGRRSGQMRQTPLHVTKVDGIRYLVAIYGEHEWVRNLRAHGFQGSLSRGTHHADVRLREVLGDEAGEVLKAYVIAIPHVRPYLDLPGSPVASDWIRLAVDRPVFRIDDQPAHVDRALG